MEKFKFTAYPYFDEHGHFNSDEFDFDVIDHLEEQGLGRIDLVSLEYMLCDHYDVYVEEIPMTKEQVKEIVARQEAYDREQEEYWANYVPSKIDDDDLPF